MCKCFLQKLIELVMHASKQSKTGHEKKKKKKQKNQYIDYCYHMSYYRQALQSYN
jgi:hypothetical protein